VPVSGDAACCRVILIWDTQHALHVSFLSLCSLEHAGHLSAAWVMSVLLHLPSNVCDMHHRSTLGCCQQADYNEPWEQDSQEGSVHVARVQPGRTAATKSLDSAQEYDLPEDNGDCQWTATYNKPVAVTDITQQIGTATAVW